MKMLSTFFVTIAALFLISCATNHANRQDVVTATNEHYPAKQPERIALYKNERPTSPYRVIGVASVSKRSLAGKERQEAELHATMKNLAASIGGDGLTNFNNKPDALEASVIKFQKLLF